MNTDELSKIIAQKRLELAELEKSSKDIGGSSIATTSTAVPPSNWWTTQNAMTVSTVVLIFGIVICALMAWLSAKDRDPEGLLRLFGTVLSVVAALFLVVAGYSDHQIAPVMALLGTIVGYLLGKEPRASKRKKPKNTDAPRKEL